MKYDKFIIKLLINVTMQIKQTPYADKHMEWSILKCTIFGKKIVKTKSIFIS